MDDTAIHITIQPAQGRAHAEIASGDRHWRWEVVWEVVSTTDESFYRYFVRREEPADDPATIACATFGEAIVELLAEVAACTVPFDTPVEVRLRP